MNDYGEKGMIHIQIDETQIYGQKASTWETNERFFSEENNTYTYFEMSVLELSTWWCDYCDLDTESSTEFSIYLQSYMKEEEQISHIHPRVRSIVTPWEDDLQLMYYYKQQNAW